MTLKENLVMAEKNGVLKLSANDWEAAEKYEDAYHALQKKQQNASDSLKKKLEGEFNANDFVKKINSCSTTITGSSFKEEI
ncbi:MAG: hypothetical protein II728_06720 [Bacteroidaceae bacterium]|nr:hypothetical protein [Bacteroidaceae bacterium]